VILRSALEWDRHLCPPKEGLAAASLWGRPASRLPRDEFAAVEPAAYRFETAGRVPALPTARMAVPTTQGPVQKNRKRACALFHDSINRENSTSKKYKNIDAFQP
jgi:hypothetical protein